MKYLKLGIVICGALGLAGMVMLGVGEMLERGRLSTVVMLIAFAIPVVMAVTGLVRPPLQVWQAGVSLACFALEAFNLRIWDLLEGIGKAPTGVKLMLAGAVLGLIVSAIPVLRPERHA